MSTNQHPNITQMKLTENQTEVLQKINERLVKGDIRDIAIKAKMHRYTVSLCLSLNSDRFNQKIIDIAIEIIVAREQITKKSLTKITLN